MNRLNHCAVAALTASLSLMFMGIAHAQSRVFNFEKDQPEKPPAGFTLGHTGQGRPGVWVVKKDEGSKQGNVLAQTDADRTSYRFPLAVVNDVTAKDVDLSVRFKPISGRVDQGAGLIWRYKDDNNYYIVRANALEGNVVLYKVENGKRTDLPLKGAGRTYGKKASVPSGQWSELAVSVRGDQFEVRFDGQSLYTVEDRTFTESGKVGLWTKADSVIYFDDLSVTAK